MLDSAGKLLEWLILTRLNEHLNTTGRRSPNQYGFRSGSSTEDAIDRLLEAAQGARAWVLFNIATCAWQYL